MFLNAHNPASRFDPSSLRARLRRETAASHGALDGLFAGLEEEQDPRLYHRFVRMNHAGHRAIEPWLARSPLRTALPDWAGRSRLAALEEDMARMDLDAIDLPPAGWIGSPDFSEALGAAYVLEGSRLGARVIRRRFAARGIQQIWPGVSLAYLDRSAADEGAKAFMAELAAIELSEADASRCVAAALAAFARFHDAAMLAGEGAR